MGLREGLVLSCLFLGAACGLPQGPSAYVDFGRTRDRPLPPEAALWLEGGNQSLVSPRIAGEAALIQGQTRRERLYRGMEYLWGRFVYDGALDLLMVTQSADTLFERGILGGCADYALVEAAFFRAMGIPVRMTVTVQRQWVLACRRNPLSLPEGHVFLEVYLEDAWYLVDSSYRILYSEIDPHSPFYPGGEIACLKGRDFQEMGLHSVEGLIREMHRCADGADLEAYREPPYRADPL